MSRFLTDVTSRGGIGIVLALALALGSVQAQEQGANEAIEEVVVTGSLIRSDSNSRAPIEIVDREQFSIGGYSNVIDVVKDLTVNSGSLSASQDVQVTAGMSQINLRGLGVGSTLTLVNGRRAGISAQDDAGNEFFDINQLPLTAIERIDVMKDGASTTYGSQAVSGVANIITRKGFEGFELSLRYEDSINPAASIGIAAGTGLGDSGSFNVYASYYKHEGGDRSDYDFIVERLGGTLQGVDPSPATSGRLTSSTGQPGSYVAAVTDPVTGEISPFSGSTFPDPDCEAAGGILVGARCRHDFFDQVSVISDEERAQIFTELDYAISDKVTFFSEMHASRNRIFRTLGPGLFQNGLVSTGAILIPGDHPFNFFVADPIAPTGIAYVDPANWDPLTDVGVDIVCLCRPLGANLNGDGNAPPRKYSTDYWRFMAGLEYAFSDNWIGEVAYQISKSRRNQTRAFNFIADVINQSALDGTWNPFGSARGTPSLVSPKDGISVAGNSEEVLNSLYTFEQETFEASQYTVDALVTGDLFEMPAGPVGFAIGGQFRDESFKFVPDALKAAAGSESRNPVFPRNGDQDVVAFFSEAVLPLTDKLEAQLALRYEDYSDKGGSTTDPKIAMRFDATDTFALRGSYGTSYQAPSMRQFSSTTSRELFDDSAVVDPITGELTCGPGGASIVGEVLTIGSPDLEPQSAANFNFGAIFQPLDGLDVVIDYWNYDYEDLISKDEGANAIIQNDCAVDGIPNDPRIERDGGGNIRRVTTFFINTARVKTDGIDLSGTYSFDAGGNDVSLTANASFINKFEFETNEGDGFTDIVGSRNTRNQFRSLPELRANIGAHLYRGDHGFHGTIRYVDSYLDDASGETIDSHTTLDIQYALSLNALFGNDGESQITIGANNVTDEEPPALGFRQRPGFDDLVHDVRGRILYASYTHTF